MAGLEEALLGARPGTKLRVLVPPELGYAGSPGAAPQVGGWCDGCRWQWLQLAHRWKVCPTRRQEPARCAASSPGLLSCVPPAQMPTFATQRQLENHKGEPLLFEVQLLRVGGQR